MNQQSTYEGNKLIAEFLKIPKCQLCPEEDHCGRYTYGPGIHYFPHEMSYHTSWDWLMPVVEKINSFPDYGIVFFKSVCHVNDYDTLLFETNVGKDGKLIDAIYEAVVQFIKYYTQKEIGNKS